MTKRKITPPRPIGSRMRLRQGEGQLLNLEQLKQIGEEGSTQSQYRVSLQEASVPDRRYAADVYSLIVRNSTFNIIFAQQRFGTSTELRSMVIVKLTRKGASTLVSELGGMGTDGGPTLQDIASKIKAAPERPIEIHAEPSQTVSLDATWSVVAVADAEACIDFYHSSAFAIAAVNAGSKLALEPAVRITLKTAQLLGLRDALRAALDSILPAPATGS